jgi:hypothetical protein
MSPKKTVGAAAGLAATVAIVGVLVGGVAASADSPEKARVGALSDGMHVRLSPVALRVLASPMIADKNPSPTDARRVGAPSVRSGEWAVVPTQDGLCLVDPGDGVTCGSGADVNHGKLMLVVAPNALPDRLTADTTTVDAGPLTNARVTGVAPDGTATVAFVDQAGEVLAHTKPSDGLYGFDGVDLGRVRAIRLTSTDGTQAETSISASR